MVMLLTTFLPSSTSREAMSKAVCDFDRARDVAEQHDAFAQAFDPDVGVRQRLLDARRAGR